MTTFSNLLTGVRAVLAVSLVPVSVMGGIAAALWAMNSGIDPEMVVFPISLASLFLVAVMERILPYRREWNRSHGDLRTDIFYYLTQIFVGGLLHPVLAMLTIIIGGWLSAQLGGSLWPVGWPILAQVLLATVTAIVVDAFQHANIAIRLGPLSWIFSIGNLHRWHHSRVRSESDKNYGNVYIFWDAVFGTRYLPGDREPPEQVGLGGMEAFPTGFWAQWLSPFRWAKIRHASSGSTPASGVSEAG